MKRDEVKAIFPNATEDEVDAVLNKIGEELNPLKRDLKTAQKERDEYLANLTSTKDAHDSLKAKYDDANAKLKEGLDATERLKALEQSAAEKEAEFLLKSAQLEAKTIFVEAGCFDAEDIEGLVAQVASTDIESTKAGASNIVGMVTKQRELVEKSTKDALLKANPKLGGSEAGSGGSMSRADFLALPYSEQMAMKEANPEIISQLT